MAMTPAIAKWLDDLPSVPMVEIAREPSAAALFCADMTIGFCRKGPLASPRIDALTRPVTELLVRAHAHGIRDFVLVQDAHTAGAIEFASFPPHCMRGTDEATTIPELTSLPFADEFTRIEKNSLHPSIGTEFDLWLEGRPHLRHAIVVGNCTDLCVYQLAMHLRLRANALDLGGFSVVVPAGCVATYDLPAESVAHGALPHDGDLLNAVFLYHLALNGVRVVKEID